MHVSPSLWPLALYAAGVLALVAFMIGASHLLGQRHRERATDVPYESGIPPVATARLRLAARYYLLAMLFVVFDIEAVLLMGWAVAAREVGWAGYGAALVFVLLLVIALVYLWRSGALDWGPSRVRRRSRAPNAGVR
jgi:NADH-quinone oxidoreductase subunit A